MRKTVAALALFLAAAAPDPPPLPLDRDGIPTRALTDEELHRLLLNLSPTNDVAAGVKLTRSPVGI